MTDCQGGLDAVCLQAFGIGPTFVGGYCSEFCQPGTCPTGSSCVGVSLARYCLADCVTDADCRQLDYRCLPSARDDRPLCVRKPCETPSVGVPPGMAEANAVPRAGPDSISGVRYDPSFLPDHGPVFDWTVHAVQWDDRIRARKTASYGVPYNYAGLTYPELPFPPVLDRVRASVSARLGFDYNNCLLNYYPDGDSRMGFHSDSAEGIVAGAGVAIVSLGGQRALRFRRAHNTSERLDYVLAPGSLLFMGPEVQEQWQHALPRTSQRAPRISLTFRAVQRTALLDPAGA